MTRWCTYRRLGAKGSYLTLVRVADRAMALWRDAIERYRDAMYRYRDAMEPYYDAME